MNANLTHADLESAVQVEEEQLSQLLSRVMTVPLEPLSARLKSVEKRVEELDERVRAIQDDAPVHLDSQTFTLQTELGKLKSAGQTQKEELEISLSKLLGAMAQDLENLAQEHVSLKQRVTEVGGRLGEQQRSLDASFGRCESGIVQSLAGIGVASDFAQTAAHQSQAAVTGIGQTRATITHALQETRVSLTESSVSLQQLCDANAVDVRAVGMQLQAIAGSIQAGVDSQVASARQEMAQHKMEFDALSASLAKANERATTFQRRIIWWAAIATGGLIAVLTLLLRSAL
jgi:hypothetical protein